MKIRLGRYNDLPLLSINMSGDAILDGGSEGELTLDHSFVRPWMKQGQPVHVFAYVDYETDEVRVTREHPLIEAERFAYLEVAEVYDDGYLMDWGIEDDRIIKGSKALFDSGPKLNTPYYTYYAMQLMYNVGGEQWTKWNARVRDDLIKTQCQDGHERGSWYPDSPGGHCASGGRLYVTSLNCMCLEVYYRHMPLYQKINRDDNFLIELPAKKQKK